MFGVGLGGGGGAGRYVGCHFFFPSLFFSTGLWVYPFFSVSFYTYLRLGKWGLIKYVYKIF